MDAFGQCWVSMGVFEVEPGYGSGLSSNQQIWFPDTVPPSGQRVTGWRMYSLSHVFCPTPSVNYTLVCSSLSI